MWSRSLTEARLEVAPSGNYDRWYGSAAYHDPAAEGHEDIVITAFWHLAQPLGTRDPLLAHGALLCSVVNLLSQPWATLTDVIGALQLPRDASRTLVVTDSSPGAGVSPRQPAYLLGRLPDADQPMLAQLFLPLGPQPAGVVA